MYIHTYTHTYIHTCIHRPIYDCSGFHVSYQDLYIDVHVFKSLEYYHVFVLCCE